MGWGPDYKFQEEIFKMRINKELWKTIAIIVLIILILGIFLLPKYNQVIYNRGFSDGQINVIQTQMQTGNIFVIVNETIQGYPIQQFCEGGG